MNTISIDTILNQYDFNLAYAMRLVGDLTDEQMTITPATGLVNHPAWTLGHLASASALLTEDLGAEIDFPKEWSVLFLRKGPGDPTLPDPDTAKYPSKKDLLDELRRQHEKVKQLVRQQTDDELKKSVQWKFNDHMPTLFDVVVFFCINHEAMHLGQLAAWRRAMGLHSALSDV
jgi:hypothetical protein